MLFNVLCITCQVNLRDTLRPIPRRDGFYYCKRCQACYQHVFVQDMFGETTDHLNPVSPGKARYSRAVDDGVQYDTDNTNSTQPPLPLPFPPPEYYTHDHITSVPLPQIEHIDLPDFEEEREIIKKSKTVKEFLKNSLYLEKPYDK